VRTNQPVTSAILERMPATIELAAAAMLVAVAFAIPLGIAAAVWRGTAVATERRRCPAGYFHSQFLAWSAAGDHLLDRARMAAGLRTRTWDPWSFRRCRSARRSRPFSRAMTRATLLEELREQYVMAARARGLARASSSVMRSATA